MWALNFGTLSFLGLIAACGSSAIAIQREEARQFGVAEARSRSFSPYEFLDTFSKGRSLEVPRASKDYVTFPVSKQGGTVANFVEKRDQLVVEGRLVQTYVFNITNPQAHFSFYPPVNGCPGMIQTSVTAKSYGCQVAMNAGYFNVESGGCHGYLVSDSSVVQNQQTLNANFGFTTNREFVIGYLNTDDVSGLNFAQLITGVGWLVRDGKVWIQESLKVEKPNFNFVNERAGRSAIGHDTYGNLIQIQVDGNEDLKEGLTLLEWASVVQNFGLINAVNLDGGSSCTVWAGQAIVNRLSRYSGLFPVPFERHVTSITCVH